MSEKCNVLRQVRVQRALGWIAFAFVLALLATAVPAAAQAGHDDPALAKEIEIRDLMLEKGHEAALGIRVRVDGETAILTGTVPTRAAQELAEEVAKSVDGIKKVDNRLQIKTASGAPPPAHTVEQEMADAHLEMRVKKQLNGEIGKYAKQIEVEATDGVVSLRGTVPDANRKKLALDTAGKTEGVKRVIDLIKIKS
ncbi:MAG TPA: BON domain-containing protein [Thermoanaerobaculia bacterium]